MRGSGSGKKPPGRQRTESAKQSDRDNGNAGLDGQLGGTGVESGQRTVVGDGALGEEYEAHPTAQETTQLFAATKPQ